MTKSVIYKDILDSIGYFKPKSNMRLGYVKDESVEKFDSDFIPDTETIIGYYPGCFSHFHYGHLQAMRGAFQRLKTIANGKPYLLVISPANSDYSIEKYGKDSQYSTNKYRYDQIVKMIKSDVMDTIDEFGDARIWIDLAPMMEWSSDQNFTDLLDDFIEYHVIGADFGINSMKNPPHIICGKDKQSYALLEKFTDKVKVMTFEGFDNLSSRDHINMNPLPLPKKNLTLRCNNTTELGIFIKYFGDHYNKVEPLFLKKEIAWCDTLVDRIHRETEFLPVTICKEYETSCNYFPIHRNWVNPFRQSGYSYDHTMFCHLDKNQEIVFIDSDCFTGGTEKFVLEMFPNAKFEAFLDYTQLPKNHYEIVDINDFINGSWKYPYVDLQSRASMKSFDHEDHLKFAEFIKELRNY